MLDVPVRRVLRAVAVGVTLAAVAAACGGGGEGVTTGSTGESSDGGAADRDLGPLAEFFGWGGDPADQNERFAEQERQAQIAIQECMAEQGFEYTPVEQASFIATDDPFLRAQELSDEEFVERYGLGISTFFEEQFEGPSPAEMTSDPNQARIDAMDDAERDAYFSALHGGFDDGPAIDESMTEEEMQAAFEEWEAGRDPASMGCEERAFDEAFDSGDTENLWASLDEGFEQMEERFESHPDVIAFNEEWRTCMADAGHPFGGPEEMYEDISNRMQPIWSSGFVEESVEFDENGDPIDTGAPTAPPYDAELLAEVQEYELTVARASFDCGVGGVFGGEAAQLADVRREIEQDFIDQNRDTLEQIRDAGGF